MTPIAVFASGRGSNLASIISAIRDHRLDARIVAVVSDQKNAGALELARAAGILALCLPAPHVSTASDGPSNGPSDGASGDAADPSERSLSVEARRAATEARRSAHEEKILEALHPLAPRFLVMAGYMRVVTSKLIEAFRSERGYSRIVNVHPSLLPAFPGVSAYEQAFRHGAKVAGVTVHLVERKVDDGPICAQVAFPIEDCRSVAEVEQRGLAIEHRLFSETLQWVLPEKFVFEERGYPRRFCVRTN